MSNIGHLCVIINSVPMNQQVYQSMTSITVVIPHGMSEEDARTYALHYISKELERYGLHQALGPLYQVR